MEHPWCKDQQFHAKRKLSINESISPLEIGGTRTPIFDANGGAGAMKAALQVSYNVQRQQAEVVASQKPNKAVLSSLREESDESCVYKHIEGGIGHKVYPQRNKVDSKLNSPDGLFAFTESNTPMSTNGFNLSMDASTLIARRRNQLDK